MNVGEFFISLAIKGGEKTVGTLTQSKKAMGELGSMSLETKAAILGVVYGFERLMSTSAQAGTNLENFQRLTGVSAQTLQQFQYAGRQVGVSNEEMASSFKGVQNAMAQMRLGKGAPEGLAMLSGKVGFDANRAKSDTTYVMKKLQEYANAEHDVAMRNFVVKSFGVGETVMAGMARNAFRPDVLKQAPTYSEKEIGQLDKANAAWSNLSNKVQMAIGHFNAAHGGELVKGLSQITNQVVKLAESFLKLAETIHLFEALGKVFEGWSAIFEGITKGVMMLTGAMNSTKKADELKQNMLGFFQEAPSVMKEMALSAGGSLGMKSAYAAPPSRALAPHAVAPKLEQQANKNSTQNNNVTQNFQFSHDGTDHKQVGDAAQKGITKAFFQIPQGGY